MTLVNVRLTASIVLAAGLALAPMAGDMCRVMCASHAVPAAAGHAVDDAAPPCHEAARGRDPRVSPAAHECSRRGDSTTAVLDAGAGPASAAAGGPPVLAFAPIVLPTLHLVAPPGPRGLAGRVRTTLDLPLRI